MSIWNSVTQERARDIIARYPQKRSAVMALLYLAIAEEGYLTDQGMEEVARWVELTPAQVQSVATFYTMYKREPTGKYLISCCLSISCMLNGSDQILETIEETSGVPAGETDPEQQISVEHVECLGACGGAPAVQVNYELIEGITPEHAKELVEWLRRTRPTAVRSDEMQELFGTRRSFDWAIPDPVGATGPFPAVTSHGTTVGKTPDPDAE